MERAKTRFEREAARAFESLSNKVQSIAVVSDREWELLQTPFYLAASLFSSPFDVPDGVMTVMNVLALIDNKAKIETNTQNY